MDHGMRWDKIQTGENQTNGGIRTFCLKEEGEHSNTGEPGKESINRD